MKIILIVLQILVAQTVWSKDFKLTNSKATYTVKHLLKTVEGESHELKGKMVCEAGTCEFLIAVPAKSFVSSDSNRDLNMQTILEVGKYPLVTAKGKMAQADLEKKEWVLKSLVSIHGIEKEYNVKIKMDKVVSGQFILKLEDHQIERPSLLTFKIDNDVPMSFVINWVE